MAIVMVTGATGGIGSALVEMLRKRGDEVYGVGRDEQRLTALGVRPVVADLARPETLEAAVPSLERLDVLVHNAGIVTLGKIADTPYHVWRDHLNVNLAAAAELTRLLLPALRAAQGQVVFVNSGAGFNAGPNWGAYAASKFGLRALADALRAEERSLRVASIHPGRTATEMQRSVRGQEGAEYDPDEYIQPDTVARLIITALDTTPDAELIEMKVRYRI
ncbi:MAG TPA: SDR family oxidoreductase [Micromonosporaceae bacterium]|jgi:NADP-dependent 3-hydroxy acid dehydrogenase YdfG|nr:SDR family oxidoreductase [Micromonosporaceae bacterium]